MQGIAKNGALIFISNGAKCSNDKNELTRKDVRIGVDPETGVRGDPSNEMWEMT